MNENIVDESIFSVVDECIVNIDKLTSSLHQTSESEVIIKSFIADFANKAKSLNLENILSIKHKISSIYDCISEFEHIKAVNEHKNIFMSKVASYSKFDFTELNILDSKISLDNGFSSYVIDFKNKLVNDFRNLNAYKSNVDVFSSFADIEKYILNVDSLDVNILGDHYFENIKYVINMCKLLIEVNTFYDNTNMLINDLFNAYFEAHLNSESNIVRAMIYVFKEQFKTKIDRIVSHLKNGSKNYVQIFMMQLNLLADYEFMLSRVNKVSYPVKKIALDESIADDFKKDVMQYYNLAFVKKYNKLHRNINLSKNIPRSDVDDFIQRVNKYLYTLTPDQVNAIYKSFDLLNSNEQTSCLIQGDVSCGKTIVTLAIIFLCAKHNIKSIYVVPRLALKLQHINTIKAYAKILDYDIKVSSSEDHNLDSDIVVGNFTMSNASFDNFNPRVGIVDEMQLLSAKQRVSILNKFKNIEMFYTTATPSGQVEFIEKLDDLHFINIKTMPVNRKRKITNTFTIDGENSSFSQEIIDKHINDQFKLNQMSIIVAPNVNKDNGNVYHNVFTCYEEYKKKFPHLNVCLLTSDLSEFDKESILLKCNQNEVDVLVTTKLIEVGVDLKKASTIVIYQDFSGFNYGVSSLHQLRGRIGRSYQQGYCFIECSNEQINKYSAINTILKYDDVFEIIARDDDPKGFDKLLGITPVNNSKLSKEKLQEKIMLYEEVNSNIDVVLSSIDQGLKIIMDEIISRGFLEASSVV